MTTFYRKEQHGKRVRYVPVAEYERWDSLPEGHHLLSIRPGQLSVRHDVQPHHAAVLAALKDGEQAILDALHNHAEPRAITRMSAREQAAFEKWKEASRQDRLVLQTPSMMDMVRALEAEMLKRITQV